MGPTSSALIIVVAAAAALVPLIAVTVAWWRSRSLQPELGWPRRLLGAVGRLAVIGLCQVLAIGAIFLVVNRSYGFYTTWNEIFGVQQSQPVDIGVQEGGYDAGTGRVETLDINGAVSGVHGQALVWLPRQYFAPTAADRKFPVMMVLPGQPSSPGIMYNEYHIGTVASQAIDSGAVKPFIAVLPPIMINPPRDTECVNVPHGPQAESWLTKDVVSAVTARYHVQPLSKGWSVMGWSTGGLCASKLALRYPTLFPDAISFGGMGHAYVDKTTGNLFGGSAQLRAENSPFNLYRSNPGTKGAKLMFVAGQQDKEVWTSLQPLLALTQGDPNVAVATFAVGGHNDKIYSSYLPAALNWLQKNGAFA